MQVNSVPVSSSARLPLPDCSVLAMSAAVGQSSVCKEPEALRSSGSKSSVSPVENA